jgi:single-stranded DNA-binding protein
MEVIGRIKVINPEQQVSATFRKRELVVVTDEQYPQFISINFVQDKCDLLNAYHPGEEVKVSINLRGREWVNPQGETKYFNDIQGWRVERMAAHAPAPAAPAYAAQQAAPTSMPGGFEPAARFEQEEQDDLPF